MSTGDDQLKKAADVKLWIESKIAELQEEVVKLKEVQALVDSVLRASSFRPASEITSPPLTKAKEPLRSTQRPEPVESGGEIPEIRELRRDKGGETIAIAQITGARVLVEPVAEVALKPETPPFRSFLVGKILTGMESKDKELVSKGKLGKGSELRFSVNEKAGRLASISIENYRENERLTEILNTIGWTFSRMLEKGAAPTSSR
ncbi:MAG: hypothetical protein OK456_04125 [Thaumarchaeota archaeon]|nr:hypothetical protein [Nitrososphaerota archaeon]